MPKDSIGGAKRFRQLTHGRAGDAASVLATCGHAVALALGSNGPILLQKSKVGGLRISCESMNRKTIANSCNFNRVTEVACEFNVRRRGPSHLYTKSAPAARRIFDHQCETTFATKSAKSGREQLQQTASLFDHLVGADEQRRRHVEAERLGGF